MTLVNFRIVFLNIITIALRPQPSTFPVRSSGPSRDPGVVAIPTSNRASIIIVDQSIRVLLVCDLSSAAAHAPTAACCYVEEWDAAVYLVDDGLHDDERAGDQGDVDFDLGDG